MPRLYQQRLSPECVSIVIPVYNGGKAFEHCLESVSCSISRPMEVIVVDDGSSDQSAVLARGLGYRVISTSGRCGPATARNLGAKHARGELLFFVDADCSIKPDTIDKLGAIFSDHPAIDAIVGSYDETPSAPGLLSQYKNLLHHYMHQTSGSEGSTFWGACGAIRREVFEEFGGFDRTYSKASIEDIELGYRLVAAGRKIRMCPELQVTHHKRWQPLNLFYTDVFLRAIPWSKLILKSSGMNNSLNTSIAARLRVALSGLIVASLVGALFLPALLWLAVILVGILIVADWSILNWFYRKKGFWFTAAILPWHWLSHFYSGVSFAWVASMHTLDNLCGSKTQTDAQNLEENLIEAAAERSIST